MSLISLLLLATEVATRYLVAPRSAIQRRIAQELTAARTLQSNDVLFAGNSLLLWGVDVQGLRQAMLPSWRAQRLVVESTSFEDWKFGLKNLFDHGSKPRAAFVVLSPQQYAQHSVLGDYFAHQLMALSDLPLVAGEMNLHPTAVTGMILANQSVFYGLRAELRKALMFAILPNLDKLFFLVNRGGPPMGEPELTRRLTDHMSQIRELSVATGVKIVAVIPPSVSGRELARRVEEIGKQASVPVILPVAPGALDPSYFSDGFHLNAKGQKVFTPALASEAQKLLDDGNNPN